MKKILLLLSVTFLFLNLNAQREKARPLKSDNPIIGCWRYMNTGDGPAVLYEGDKTRFLWFGSGGKSTVAAQDYSSDDQNFLMTSNFVAYTDGKKIYGKIFKSSIRTSEGKEISFSYSYQKGRDRLKVSLDGKSYAFERVNPVTMEVVKK